VWTGQGVPLGQGLLSKDLPSLATLRRADGHFDAEESELAEAGLVRLPEKSLPDSFWEMPAPQVSFADAVAAVTSERKEH
jgi:hypothetical protein